MSEVLVKAEALSKVFPPVIGQPAKEALRGLSLEVRRGETFGLLGPNGAGKTTTQKLLLGLCRPTSGTVTLFGLSPSLPEARKSVGFLPENPYFYTYLTGREFLFFCGGMFDLTKRQLQERIEEMLELVEMKKSAGIQLRKYSKGMLQRIGIAQALINDPDLILLDEPMSGLDPVGRRQFRQIILRLKEQGKTVFFNSHILSDVEDICDRFAILYEGKMIAYDTLAGIAPAKLEDYFVSVVESQ
jgi:ABC-2 type transport system ATP-binding protein